MIASAHAGEKGLHVFEHEVQTRLLLRIWVQMGLQLLLQEAHRHTQICTVECLAHSRDPANGWGEDGRIAWTLKTLGLNKVVIVDGGLPAIKKLGALSIKPLKIPGDFVVARTNKWEVRKEELRDRIAQKNTIIFDVREPREFEGKTPYGESRGGHVPGAKGLWYKDFIAKDGQLLPRADIEKVLASKGVTKDSEIVSYCTGGIRSGWFTTLLNDLGYKAKNYPGSMWEWSAQAPAQYPLTTN